MLLVLVLMGALYGLGAWMGAPRSARFAMIGLVYLAVVLLHLTLGDTHPLRLSTGKSPALWLMLGGATALVLAYRSVLIRLKQKATGAAPTPAAKPRFTETELNRYARHIVLREVGGPGQKSLKDARVLVIGAGGLGSPALLYLAAAGVGTIGVIDEDLVDNSNLQRQVIHRDADIGLPKVQSAAKAMKAQNPFVTVRPYQRRFDDDIAADLLKDYDLLLDGTDNFATRYLANRAAVAAGIPLVSGALSQWEGQISVFDPKNDAPCYQCIFPEAPAPGLAPSCAEAGVIGPLPGVIGAIMALEAIKVITKAGAPLRGDMLIYDALYGETRRMRLKRRPDCPVCGG